MGFALLTIVFILGLFALGIMLLTWILATLLPLVGVTATITYLHGLALFLFIGLFTTRVRRE